MYLSGGNTAAQTLLLDLHLNQRPERAYCLVIAPSRLRISPQPPLGLLLRDPPPPLNGNFAATFRQGVGPLVCDTSIRM